MSTKRLNHVWSPAEDEQLLAEVTLMESVSCSNLRFWHAVVGRLAPEIVVTPDSARHRYERLLNIQVEAQKQLNLPPVRTEIEEIEQHLAAITALLSLLRAK